MLLYKSQWAYLMEVASICIDRKRMKVFQFYANLYGGKISVSKLNPSLHHRTQLLLILKQSIMRKCIKHFIDKNAMSSCTFVNKKKCVLFS